MKIHEAIRIYKPIIDNLGNYGIKVDDVRHIDLYDEFIRLKNEGHKITYIASHLSSEYNVSERTVYAIVKKMEEEIK
jgi:Mor family transcriptional regulator